MSLCLAICLLVLEKEISRSLFPLSSIFDRRMTANKWSLFLISPLCLLFLVNRAIKPKGSLFAYVKILSFSYKRSLSSKGILQCCHWSCAWFGNNFLTVLWLELRLQCLDIIRGLKTKYKLDWTVVIFDGTWCMLFAGMYSGWN